ncbi:unnamed protein product, partial [Mesorhabditis spiculigera]
MGRGELEPGPSGQAEMGNTHLVGGEPAVATDDETGFVKEGQMSGRESKMAPPPSAAPTTPTRSTDLESKPWYHGMRPRKECEALLVDKGDWLVRATDNDKDGRLLIILSIVDPKRVAKHLTIAKDDKGRFFVSALKEKDRIPFPSVVELMEHYTKKGGIGALKLGQSKNRPNWMLKHEQVNFDEAKDRLGSGNYCVVYKGIFRDETRAHTVAVKVALPLAEERTPEQITRERQSMLREAELIASYSHPNVIRLFGVAADHPPVQIVLEYCPGGSLDRHLQEYRDRIESTERVVYMMDAADGMQYLHGQNCIHRDIAARNCLIAETGWIKISDFGLSKNCGKDETKEKDIEADMGLPIRWMAPEALQKNRTYSKKSDVWSLGVMIWETFNNGIKPWPDWETKKIATYIRKGKMPEFPESTPAKLKEFVQTRVWVVDPENRADMKEVFDQLKAIVKAPKRPVINRLKPSKSYCSEEEKGLSS